METERDAAGPTADERADGERLVAEMTPGEWWNESQVIHAPLGDHRASHPVSTQTDEDADAICWLRNHAAQLLADSVALAHESRQRELAQLNMGLHIESFEAAYAAFDAERKRLDAELARERRRAAALRASADTALTDLESATTVVEEVDRKGGGQGVLLGIGLLGLRAARDTLATALADAPGPGEEGEGR